MRRLSKKTRSNLALFIALSVMVLLFYASSRPYAEQSLVRPLDNVLNGQPFADMLQHIRFLYGGQEVSIEANGYVRFIEFFIRKAAHFSAYFVLGYAWSATLRGKMKERGTGVLLALIICVSYAAFDEFHQSLTPNRTPLLEDVLLDTVGASFGVLLQQFKKK